MLLTRRRGMVLSLAIVILVILLVLATAVTSMGTGNLNFAMGQMNNERAYQAAEAGLSYAYTDISMGTAYVGTPPSLPPQKVYAVGPNGDQAAVAFYDNLLGTTPQPAGCPVTIPSGFVYLVATGQLKTGTQITNEKKVGAMIALRSGGSMSYGVNCQSFNMDQGVLTAYDLKSGQEVSNYPVAASNTTGPSQAFVELAPLATKSVEIRGNVVLPVGVDSTSVLQGHFTFASGQPQNLASPLNFPETKVPVLVPRTQSLLQGGTLPEGHYSNLNVNLQTSLSGRYVIDNLQVNSFGALHLETGATAELYVKSLTANGIGSIIRHSGSSNHLKFFYQGTDPLTLHLGSDSHLSLIAPNADVTIYGTDLTLGAFAARNLNVVMPGIHDRFCFDPTSAQPVRTTVSTSTTDPPPRLTPPTQYIVSPPPDSDGSDNSSIESIIPGYKAITVVGRQRF